MDTALENRYSPPAERLPWRALPAVCSLAALPSAFLVWLMCAPTPITFPGSAHALELLPLLAAIFVEALLIAGLAVLAEVRLTGSGEEAPWTRAWPVAGVALVAALGSVLLLFAVVGIGGIWIDKPPRSAGDAAAFALVRAGAVLLAGSLGVFILLGLPSLALPRLLGRGCAKGAGLALWAAVAFSLGCRVLEHCLIAPLQPANPPMYGGQTIAILLLSSVLCVWITGAATVALARRRPSQSQ